MKAFTYAVCPHCEHPNVHVENGRLCEHVISIAGPEKCPGSMMETSEARQNPLNRHTAEFREALREAVETCNPKPQPKLEQGAAFSFWTFSGQKYIAVPHNDGFSIADSSGNNFGAWMSVENFRKRQQSGVLADWQPLGKCRLQLVCERTV